MAVASPGRVSRLCPQPLTSGIPDRKVSSGAVVPGSYFQRARGRDQDSGGRADGGRERDQQASHGPAGRRFGGRAGVRVTARGSGRRGGPDPRGRPSRAAARVRAGGRAAARAAEATRRRRRGVPPAVTATPLVRGSRPARRTGSHGGAAQAHRHGRALPGVRRGDRHRRRVPAGPADPDGRGHRLRPGVGVEAVHLDPRGAADRTGPHRAGGAGRLVPAGLRPGGQTGRDDTPPPHAHVRVPRVDPAVHGADVRGEGAACLRRGARRPAGHRVPVLRPEPDLAPAGAGARHRAAAGRAAPRGDHRAARHAPYPLQPSGVMEAEDRGHRGRPPAVVRAGPGAGVGRGARRERVQPRRGRGPRGCVLRRVGPGGPRADAARRRCAGGSGSCGRSRWS